MLLLLWQLRGGAVQGVTPLLQVSIWGHERHRAGGETRAQYPPLQARLGRAELPVTTLCGTHTHTHKLTLKSV